MLPFIV